MAISPMPMATAAGSHHRNRAGMVICCARNMTPSWLAWARCWPMIPRSPAAFLKTGLADLLHLFRAAMLLGAAGKPAIGAAWQADLASAPRLRLLDTMHLGPDLLETFAFAERAGTR